VKPDIREARHLAGWRLRTSSSIEPVRRQWTRQRGDAIRAVGQAMSTPRRRPATKRISRILKESADFMTLQWRLTNFVVIVHPLRRSYVVPRLDVEPYCDCLPDSSRYPPTQPAEKRPNASASPVSSASGMPPSTTRLCRYCVIVSPCRSSRAQYCIPSLVNVRHSACDRSLPSASVTSDQDLAPPRHVRRKVSAAKRQNMAD
jgi:hypothetical protein